MSSLSQLAAATVLSGAAIGVAAAASDADLAALEVAVAQGDSAAQTQLATRYQYAEDLPKDLERAREFYCRAARQANAEAQFQLGWLYANARGVPRDDAAAASLFGMAARRGHRYAATLLRYVPPRSVAQLPSCLTPDRQPTAETEGAEPVPCGRADVERLVYRLAPQYRVDPKLALALISVESAFNSAAVSPKNAQGLMQLMPQTAERFGVKKVLNPAENLKGGLAYLRWLLAYFEGDVRLVVAAYNAGEGAIEKYRGVPPYPETLSFVRKVSAIYGRTRLPFDADVVGPSRMVRGTSISRR